MWIRLNTSHYTCDWSHQSNSFNTKHSLSSVLVKLQGNHELWWAPGFWLIWWWRNSYHMLTNDKKHKVGGLDELVSANQVPKDVTQMYNVCKSLTKSYNITKWQVSPNNPLLTFYSTLSLLTLVMCLPLYLLNDYHRCKGCKVVSRVVKIPLPLLTARINRAWYM